VRLSRIEGVTVALRSTPATPPHTQLAYRRERLE
jgi:hypothetical protein